MDWPHFTIRVINSINLRRAEIKACIGIVTVAATILYMYRINEVGNQRFPDSDFRSLPGPLLLLQPHPPSRQKLITAARYTGVGVINYRGGATNSHLYRHTQKFMEHVLCAVWEIIPGLITRPARACPQLWGNKMAITKIGLQWIHHRWFFFATGFSDSRGGVCGGITLIAETY